MSEFVGDNGRGRAISSAKQQGELIVGESRHGVDAPRREPNGFAEAVLHGSRMFPSMLDDKPWQRVQADADDAGLTTESFGPDQLVSEFPDEAVPGREAGGGIRGIQPREPTLLRLQLTQEPCRQREEHCQRCEIPGQDADAGHHAGREIRNRRDGGRTNRSDQSSTQAVKPGYGENCGHVERLGSQHTARCGVDNATSTDPAGCNSKRIARWFLHEINRVADAQKALRAGHA